MKAKDHFQAQQMFGDVMYRALEDIIKYVEDLSRIASYRGCKRNDGFHAKHKYINSTILNGRKHYLEVIKTLFECEEFKLPITYAEYVHKEKFQKFGIISKILELYQKASKPVVAKFYVDVIKIFEEISGEDEVGEKIDKALQEAKEKGMQEACWVPEFKEEINFKNNTNTEKIPKKTNFNSKKQRKKSKQITKNSPLKHKEIINVGSTQTTSPSVLDENREESQQEHIVLQCVNTLQERFDKSRYRLHRRILRWSGATVDQIKNFDRNKVEKTVTYANLSEKDIMLQKAYHDLQGVELLLFVDDHQDYFFKTSKGKSAFAAFEIEGSIYEGMLELGISDKGDVYHMMFNDKVKHTPEQLFQITDPVLEDSFEDSLENNNGFSQWCNKNGFQIEKKAIHT